MSNLDLNQLDHINSLVKIMFFKAQKHFGVEFMITSLFRPGDMGVHGYGRGLDFSCPNIKLGQLIEDYINSIYMYDYVRPYKKCCIFHDTGTGYHIHIQAHPNTKEI